MTVWNKNLGKIRRPLLRYYGGKWNIADFIIQHFPPHRIYLEPFGGGASVLFRKQRAEVEIYNDIDPEMVNVFEVIADEKLFKKLKHMLLWTPYSRSIYENAYTVTGDRVKMAWRTLVLAGLGHGAKAAKRTGFRSSDATKMRKNGASEWSNWKIQLDNFRERMANVVIESIDANILIGKYNYPDCLVYIDPPYLKSSIEFHDKSGYYKYEIDEEQHIQLAETLKIFKGMVIISGYDNELYRELFKGWQTDRCLSYAQGNKNGKTPRKEMIWMNRKCVEGLTGMSMRFALDMKATA